MATMLGNLNPGEEAQLRQTIEMFEVITQSQPNDYQSLEILKEAYLKLGMEKQVVATSKRIAKAYVQIGQLSSAILEYETILQRQPDDPDALAAMAQIENKANNLTTAPPPAEVDKKKTPAKVLPPGEIDDGRQAMLKVFVEGKIITQPDFDAHWPAPNLTEPAKKPVEPFLHFLPEKGLVTLDRSLRLVADRARLPYLPIERYDIDVDLARTFPRETCLRWCVLPFDRMSKSVMVATANPFNKQAMTEIEQATKNRLLWYVASPPDLLKMLGKVFR